MTTPAHGVEQIGFVKVEGTFDTTAAFTTDHGFGYSKLELKPMLEFKELIEHVGSASLQGEFEAKRGGDWSLECYHKVNGAATEPQHGPFIKAAGFTFAAGIYGLDSLQPRSLQVGRRAGDSLYEMVNGLWVEKIEIENVGGEATMFKASGKFASYGAVLGVPVTSANTYASGVSTVVLATASKWKVRPGVYVAFGANTNSGAGYRVTAVAADGVTLSISPAIAGTTVPVSSTVTPITPAATISGTVIGGIGDGLTIDTVGLGVISHKISMDTGVHGLDKESTTNRANRLARGKRSISVENEFYFLDENASTLGGTWSGQTLNLAYRAGADAAGSRLIHNTPKVRMKVASLDIPDAEETTWKGESIARQNSASNDEFTIDTN